MRLSMVLLSAALLSACQHVPGGGQAPGPISPRQAVFAAADAAPASVPGTFGLLVRATGREGPRVYLNSELDYRDQRNLTIAISPRAAIALESRFGARPDDFFKGRFIEVKGAARRVRINFTDHGRPTGKYYYQTHVAVDDPEQIAVAAP